ncbi:YcxB family protein [[Eubacterium] hominis]|uniref:YcxB family protein n=1 Tax=[Eubacterium] hominis TaxID=2764325 RepID=UPI003A4E4FEB
MIIENHINVTDFKDISKSVNFMWKKNFRIIMWLAPLMIPVSFLLHIFLNVYDFSLIFIFISILTYGEKFILESVYSKKQSRLLVSNFKTDNLHYTVTFTEKEIIVNYHQNIQGQSEGTISYDSIKRVIESKNYYNIIGEKAYLLPIEKRNISNNLKRELLTLLKSKNIQIYQNRRV